MGDRRSALPFLGFDGETQRHLLVGLLPKEDSFPWAKFRVLARYGVCVQS